MSSTSTVSRPWLGPSCAFALFLGNAVLTGQTFVDWGHAVSSGLTRERVIGLVNVPDLVGDACGPEVPVNIDLYGTPSTAKPPIGAIEFVVTGRQPEGRACGSAQVVLQRAGAGTTEAMPMEESGYEIPAAIAYERVGQWFRIALPRGSAWMMSGDPKHFEQYPDMLLKDHLTHMAAGWDGRLWSMPGGASAKVLSPELKSFLKRLEGYRKEGVSAGGVDVDVLAVRRVGGEMWIQVRVTDGHCEGQAATLDTGWVPAHGATRKPSVWFYSRGC